MNMNAPVTQGDLLWLIFALTVGTIIAHMLTDLAKLFWQRHKARKES